MKKVIKGLECCLGANDCDIEPNEDCPYKGMCLCAITLRLDVLALLNEQKAVQWINVNDKLPENDGQYLVVYTFFDYRAMGVVRFSHNLHEIDEYIFESRPGWYEPDDEVGYFERTTVTHWAKLPEFPKEG